MTRIVIRRAIHAAGAAIVLACALGASACILKETRSVMYVDDAGAVTWSVTESDAHSDAETAAERADEETAYREQMLANPAPMATLLESLGGYGVTRTVLKGEAPFEVHTLAHFDRIDVLFERICALGGFLCTAHLETTGRRTTLFVDVIGRSDSSNATPDLALDLLDHLTLVAVGGRFVEASGFTLDDSRKATMPDDDPAAGVTLTLTWEK